MLFLSEWVNKFVVKWGKIMKRLSCIKSFVGGRLFITNLGTFMELRLLKMARTVCGWVNVSFYGLKEVIYELGELIYKLKEDFSL